MELLSQEPELDYLTMDYLAEVSMSILAQQMLKDPTAGYPRDFLGVIKSLAPYWFGGGKCKLIVNAGGLNPRACAMACVDVLHKEGCRSMKIGIVEGDNVLPLLQASDGGSTHFSNLDTGRDIREVRDRLITANAYLGSQGIVDALQAGADIVITGRIADPSLVVGPCRYEFGWSDQDWDRIAGATLAGHLIECGTHVTGGISTDWLQVPDSTHIGFPIVEVNDAGECVVTKSSKAGGCVTLNTVKEQLIYEIFDPRSYLSPEVTASFENISLELAGENRVHVRGASGSPMPPTLKVSATYRDGYRAAGMLTIIGSNAALKAKRTGEIILQRLAESGATFRDTIIECLGSGASVPVSKPEYASPQSADASMEVVLRVAVESDSKESVEQFTRAMIPMVTAGPQGTTGYAEGRPKVHDVIRYWPCLIESSRATAKVELFDCAASIGSGGHPNWPQRSISTESRETRTIEVLPHSATKTLELIAIGRSGDKGTGANIGIAVRDTKNYEWLKGWLTSERVANYFALIGVESVERFEFEAIQGLNFHLRGILRRSLRNDAQGKALAQALLAMPLPKDFAQ